MIFDEEKITSTERCATTNDFMIHAFMIHGFIVHAFTNTRVYRVTRIHEYSRVQSDDTREYKVHAFSSTRKVHAFTFLSTRIL